MPNLTNLSIFSNNIDNKGIKELCNNFSNITNLLKLDIDSIFYYKNR